MKKKHTNDQGKKACKTKIVFKRLKQIIWIFPKISIYAPLFHNLYAHLSDIYLI